MVLEPAETCALATGYPRGSLLTGRQLLGGHSQYGVIERVSETDRERNK
jgi:hypothetical protein